jgi:imidazole glycerol-phosphate synthase subunit HisH
MTHVAIIDCGAGNLHSVRKAIATQLPAGATLAVVTDVAALDAATHIVLPGVGAFADCMQGFNALSGMRAALEKKVLEQGTPFLGICVGMQMLFQRGYEHGVHDGLGWFEGEVRLLEPQDASLRIPHMGWNRLQRRYLDDASTYTMGSSSLPPRGRAGVGPFDGESIARGNNAFPLNGPHLTSPLGGEEPAASPLLHNINDDDFVYFVHSYAATACNPAEILATVDYGGDVVALIGRDTIMGTQFHPEKSQAVGLRMLQNFIGMTHAS